MLDSVVISLPTDQEIPVSIPGSIVGFSLVDNSSTIFTDWRFLCFIILCLCSLLCCLRRMPLYSADYSRRGPKIVSIFYIWSLETRTPNNEMWKLKKGIFKANFMSFILTTSIFYIQSWVYPINEKTNNFLSAKNASLSLLVKYSP